MHMHAANTQGADKYTHVHAHKRVLTCELNLVQVHSRKHAHMSCSCAGNPVRTCVIVLPRMSCPGMGEALLCAQPCVCAPVHAGGVAGLVWGRPLAPRCPGSQQKRGQQFRHASWPQQRTCIPKCSPAFFYTERDIQVGKCTRAGVCPVCVCVCVCTAQFLWRHSYKRNELHSKCPCLYVGLSAYICSKCGHLRGMCSTSHYPT